MGLYFQTAGSTGLGVLDRTRTEPNRRPPLVAALVIVAVAAEQKDDHVLVDKKMTLSCPKKYKIKELKFRILK
jgi:hypothetical protein